MSDPDTPAALSAERLDDIEAKAKAALNTAWRSRASTEFRDSYGPATMLALIAMARQPAAPMPGGEEILARFDELIWPAEAYDWLGTGSDSEGAERERLDWVRQRDKFRGDLAAALGLGGK